MEDLKIDYDFYCKENISSNTKSVILYYENETWDLTGWYSCSDNGIVWSEDRLIICSNGQKQLHKSKVLRPQWDKSKKKRKNLGSMHLCVTIIQCGKEKNPTLHKVIANSFLGSNPYNWDISHEDGNAHNNYLSNLNYKSRQQHMIDDNVAFKISQTKSNKSKLSTSNIITIRELFNSKKNNSYTALAKKFNCSISHIWQIINNNARING